MPPMNVAKDSGARHIEFFTPKRTSQRSPRPVAGGTASFYVPSRVAPLTFGQLGSLRHSLQHARYGLLNEQFLVGTRPNIGLHPMLAIWREQVVTTIRQQLLLQVQGPTPDSFFRSSPPVAAVPGLLGLLSGRVRLRLWSCLLKQVSAFFVGASVGRCVCRTEAVPFPPKRPCTPRMRSATCGEDPVI